jgi:hypothetical protein
MGDVVDTETLRRRQAIMDSIRERVLKKNSK